MNRMFLSFLNSMQTNSQNAQNPGLWVNGMRQPIREENAGKIDRNLLRKGNEEQDNPRNFEDEPVLAADGIMDVVKPILSTQSWPGSMLGNPAPRGGTDVNQMGTDNVRDIEQGTRDEEAARLAATAKANPYLTDRMKEDPRNHAALIRAGKMTQQEADTSTKPKSTNTKQDDGYNPGGIMSGQYMPKAMQENTNRSMFLTHLQSMQTKSQDAQNPGLWVNGNRMPMQEQQGEPAPLDPPNEEDEIEDFKDRDQYGMSKSDHEESIRNPIPNKAYPAENPRLSTDRARELLTTQKTQEHNRMVDYTAKRKLDDAAIAAEHKKYFDGKKRDQELKDTDRFETRDFGTFPQYAKNPNSGGLPGGRGAMQPEPMQENTNRSMFLTHLQGMQTKSQDAQNPGLWVNGNRMPVQESLLGAAVRGIGQVAKFGYNLGNNLGNGMMNAANTAVSGSPLKPYPQPSPFRPEPLRPSIRPPRPLKPAPVRPSPGQSPYPPGPGEDGGDAGAVRPDQDPDRFRPRPEQQIGSMLVPFDPPGRRPHPDYPIGPPGVPGFGVSPGYRPRPSPGWRPRPDPGSTPDWAPDYPYPNPSPRPSPGGRLPGLINPKPKSPTEITVDDIINPNTGNVSLSTGEANKPGAVTLHPEGQNILNPPAKPKFNPQKDYIRPRPGPGFIRPDYSDENIYQKPDRIDHTIGAAGNVGHQQLQKDRMDRLLRKRGNGDDANSGGLGIIPLQADPNLMNRMY